MSLLSEATMIALNEIESNISEDYNQNYYTENDYGSTNCTYNVCSGTCNNSCDKDCMDNCYGSCDLTE